MKKKIALIVLTCLFVTASFAGIMSTQAAIKENMVSDRIMTDNGIFSMHYFDRMGDNIEDVYNVRADGGRYKWTGVGWREGYLTPLAPLKKSDIKSDTVLTVMFDVYEMSGGSAGFYIVPFTSGVSAIDNAQFVTKSNGQYSTAGIPEGLEYKIKNAAGTELAIGAGWLTHGLTEGYVNDYVTAHGALTYWIEIDVSTKTLSAYYGFRGSDTAAQVKTLAYTIENAYKYDSARENHYFTLVATGAGAESNIEIDNFTMFTTHTENSETVKTVLTDIDFEDTSKLRSGATGDAGDLYVVKGSRKLLSELQVINPADDNRMVTLDKIVVDQNISQSLYIETGIKFTALPAQSKMGFAFGLAKDNSAVDTGSYFYFTPGQAGKTLLVIQPGEGNAVTHTIDSDLVGDEFNDIAVTATRAGHITVNVNGTDYTAEGMVIGGYFAVWQENAPESPALQYSFTPKFSIINYTYRSGSGTDLANNFNSGYINPANFSMQSTTSGLFTDPAIAEGLVIEDGKLFYKGSSTHTHFAFNETYADFILEFDYTSYNISERPEIEPGNTYSGLGISIAKPNPLDTWSLGKLIILRDYDTRKDFNPVYTQFYTQNGAKGLKTAKIASAVDGTEADHDIVIDGQYKKIAYEQGMPAVYGATTRLRLVAINNVVTLTAIYKDAEGEITELEIFSEQVDDTFGYVSLSADSCAWFAIDNISITNVDARVLAGETQAEILADYVNFKEIENELRTLAAPAITIIDNNVRWNAVAFSDGYIVTVNGVAQPKQTGTTFALDMTEPGDYVITVKAVGKSGISIDSASSNTVTHTINAAGDTGGCKGCGGVVTYSVIGLFVMLGAAAIVLRKRKAE